MRGKPLPALVKEYVQSLNLSWPIVCRIVGDHDVIIATQSFPEARQHCVYAQQKIYTHARELLFAWLNYLPRFQLAETRDAIWSDTKSLQEEVTGENFWLDLIVDVWNAGLWKKTWPTTVPTVLQPWISDQALDILQNADRTVHQREKLMCAVESLHLVAIGVRECVDEAYDYSQIDLMIKQVQEVLPPTISAQAVYDLFANLDRDIKPGRDSCRQLESAAQQLYKILMRPVVPVLTVGKHRCKWKFNPRSN